MSGLILVLNLGSTSFKFKLYDFTRGEELLASGHGERIGGQGGTYVISTATGETSHPYTAPTHDDAFDHCLTLLEEAGLLASVDRLDAVGYKAVHGGPLHGAMPVDDALLAIMERYTAFAPAHNPMYLSLMGRIGRRYPGLQQLACFETDFHTTVPAHRRVYGVPWEWEAELGIRRYGFHGSSHSYIAGRMAELAPGARRVISLHLGGSSSICAILDGKSIATSMGATPQSGLFQNNRVGDFDPFCIPLLVEKYGSLDAVLGRLSRDSGFLGLSGVSNDLRDVLAARRKGNSRADLAFRAFCDSIIGYVGMYCAYLGGLDALVFTGGIGVGSEEVRREVCGGLAYLGITAEDTAGTGGRIGGRDSGVAVMVLPTNEELMVARHVAGWLRHGGGHD